MQAEKADAFIIPSTDPHMSEYVAPHWQSREWISGFTGSAGTVVVTHDKAGLWTDSRYFLQAAQQLEGTGIDLYKEMLPETPSISEFLCRELEAGSTVGIDGYVFSMLDARQLRKELANKQIELKTWLTRWTASGQTARPCHRHRRVFMAHNMLDEPAGKSWRTSDRK